MAEDRGSHTRPSIVNVKRTCRDRQVAQITYHLKRAIDTVWPKEKARKKSSATSILCGVGPNASSAARWSRKSSKSGLDSHVVRITSTGNVSSRRVSPRFAALAQKRKIQTCKGAQLWT